MSLSIGLNLNVGRRSGGAEAFPAWLSQIAKGVDGATSQFVVTVGDSTEIGVKSSDAGNNTDAFKNAPFVAMASLAAQEGFNARSDAYASAAYGFATNALATAYRPGLDAGSWLIRGLSGMSTRIMRDNAGLGSLTLSDAAAFDGLHVYSILEAVGSSAQFTVTVDGNVVSTISGSTSNTPPGAGGSPRQLRTTVAGLTKKQQNIVLNRVASDINVCALIPFASDKSELVFVTIAAAGMTTVNAVELNGVSSAPRDYTMGNSGTYLPRAATIVGLGINDMLQSLSSGFAARLAAIEANHGARVWQLAYDGQTGEFTAGQVLTGATSGAAGTIKRVEDVNTTGTLYLTNVVGTFIDNEAITDAATGSALANGTSQLFNHGRLLWRVPHYISPSEVATETQEAFHAAILAQAAGTGRPVLDTRAKFGTYNDMVASGDIDVDGVHLTKQGSSKLGSWTWQSLRSLP